MKEDIYFKFEDNSHACPWYNHGHCKGMISEDIPISDSYCDVANCGPFFWAKTLIEEEKEND